MPVVEQDPPRRTRPGLTEYSRREDVALLIAWTAGTSTLPAVSGLAVGHAAQLVHAVGSEVEAPRPSHPPAW